MRSGLAVFRGISDQAAQFLWDENIPCYAPEVLSRTCSSFCKKTLQYVNGAQFFISFSFRMQMCC